MSGADMSGAILGSDKLPVTHKGKLWKKLATFLCFVKIMHYKMTLYIIVSNVLKTTFIFYNN